MMRSAWWLCSKPPCSRIHSLRACSPAAPALAGAHRVRGQELVLQFEPVGRLKRRGFGHGTISKEAMGNGEWGMGNERQIRASVVFHSPFPIPHSPLESFPILTNGTG